MGPAGPHALLQEPGQPEPPTRKEVKLGYSSHRHSPPCPEALAGALSVRKSLLWRTPTCPHAPAASVKGKKKDPNPGCTVHSSPALEPSPQLLLGARISGW